MVDRYLVLANSRKEGGRCVAVVDQHGNWLRPVSGVGTGELSADHCIHAKTRRTLLPLDVVAAEFGEPAPNHYQPEDHLPPTAWIEPDWIDPDDLAVWLDRSVGHDADFLARGRNDRISEASLRSEPVHSSLALMRPDTLEIIKTQSYRGNPQVRARFRSSDVRNESGTPIEFNLVVTDDPFEEKVWRSDQDRITLAPGPSPAYLTVSLGVPYNGDHYKLVAAVITEDEITQARGRAGVLPF